MKGENGKMKSDMEQTEIEAPYELPEGWKWVQQNEVCKLTDGEKRTGTEFPYLEVKYLRGKKEKDFVSTGKFIKAGTKVILVDGENSGEVFTVPEDGFMGSTFKALEISNVNENYLQYFIHTKKDLYRNNKKGSAIPHLDKKLFFTMPFPLPPTLAEQQRIVNRIESMLAKLDEAKEKAQNVVDGFETRKAAILHKAFTGELTAKWRKENGVSDDSWEEKTIGELFTHTTGKALKKDNQIGTLRKYITTSNLYWGRFDFSEVREMYFTDGELEKCTAKKGDLLVCNGGDVGRSAIWDFDYDICLQNHVSKLRKKDNNIETRLFFYYFMLSKIKGNVTAKGIGISSLSQKDLLAMKINLPTLPEQQEIVRILDSVLEKERIAKQAAESALEQIDLLKKSILARAFRGEL